MKLPSINQLFEEMLDSFRRFPLVIVDAIVGTTTGIILMDHAGPPQASFLFKILFASMLGFPLLLALALFAEKRKYTFAKAFGLQVIGVLLILGYASTVPSAFDGAPELYLNRFFVLLFALCFLVQIAAFTSRGEINGFWHFNKAILLRAMLAFLYGVVLQIGLSLALAALDHLFGIEIDGKRYPELWILLIGVFSTWFFLAGIPKNLNEPDSPVEYPKGIKVFAQYIVLPIVIVYAVILYVYLAKILYMWDWPQGWVSKLIIGFSVTGTVSFVLLYPIRNNAENVWIKLVSDWFYRITIPLLPMLFLAVWRRTSEYGLTEGRYLAFVYGIWLTGIVVYFIVSKTKSIKVIFVSLCIVTFLITFGPWGMFSVSEQNQVNRLRHILEKNSLLVNQKIQKAQQDIPVEDRREISAIIKYLNSMHGLASIQPWFTERLTRDTSETIGWYISAKEVTDIIGIEFEEAPPPNRFATMFFADKQRGIDVGGYDRILRAQSIDFDARERSTENKELRISTSKGLDTLFIRTLVNKQVRDSISISLRSMLDSLPVQPTEKERLAMPHEKMSATGGNERFKVKIVFSQILFGPNRDKAKPIKFEYDVLYTIPKESGKK
jgi:hypothetical protein